MRISLIKDDPLLELGETLVHVEASEIYDLPTYSHSFNYKVPSGTDKKGKTYGEIIIYTDKNAASVGNSYSFDLEECRNKDCKKEDCPVAKPNRLLVADVFHTKPKGNTLQALGAALFQALFSSYAGQLLNKTKPTHPNGGIYLQLNNNDDLDAIPWEYANDRTKFLVHQRIFVRIQERPQAPLPNLPIRIVAVVPDPLSTDLVDLHLSEQFHSFINGFTKNKKAVKLERVFPPTVRQMDVQLMKERKTATVLHFMGHCGQNGADGPKALIFEHSDNGKPEYIDTSRLVSTPDNLRLAFLSACDSRDIARILVERGVPYTIGSNCPIPDDLARQFEFEFYKFLTGSSTVERAMYQARASLQNQDDIRRHGYFAGTMVLYSSKFREDDCVFKCEDGDPNILLYEPPHNLTELHMVSSLYGRKKELSKLYTDLKRMVDRGTRFPHIYTVKGVGGQEFVAEAMKRMAHLFPGGIFAWSFDKEITSATDYFRRLVEVIFPNEVWAQLMEHHSSIQQLGLAIIKKLRTHSTCLLILYHADILDLGETERNMHAMELGTWFRRISSEQIKILVISSEPLHWCTGEVMNLNDSIDLGVYRGGDWRTFISDKERIHDYFTPIKEPIYFYGVPTKNRAFVERSNILESMEAALGKSGACRILALSGLGGMGKTQLMLRYCYLHRVAYDYVFWLEVDSWSAAIESFRNLAIKLGMNEESIKGEDEEKKIIDWVLSWLQERTKWLLLLNNCDGDDMDKKVFKLLPRIGGNIILTTRLYIPSKKATVIHVDKMQEEEALFLLLGILSMDSIDKESAKFSYAREITAMLDYMPLAIALASAYVKDTATPLQRYLSMLQERKKRIKLFKYNDDYNDYKHTVATVWQLSFDRICILNPIAVQILEACAFLQPENIPVRLFQQQHSILELVSTPSVNEQDSGQSLDDIKTAVAVLVKFSFVMRTYNEMEDNYEDPANDLLTIHRLVQKVIYDAMDNKQIQRWTHIIPIALEGEINFSERYSSITQRAMHTYLSHIRYLATLISNYDQQFTMSSDIINLLNETNIYLWHNGMYFDMGETAQLSVKLSETMHGLEHTNTATSLNDLARHFEYQGKYDEAEPLYKRALAIREKMLGPEHPDTVTTQNNLAVLYVRQGKYDEAEPLYQRALAMCEKVLGSEHPDTAATLNNLARLYVRQGKYDEAEPLHQQALATREKVLGSEHPDTARTLNSLAWLYFSQGKYGEAEPLYQRALAIREKVLGSEHPDTAGTLNNLAGFYSSQGKYDEAEPLHQQALAICEKVLGSEHPDTAGTLNSLAWLYESQGKYDEAEPLYQRALAISEKVLGSEHPDTATTLNNLARLYESQGKYDEAELLYQRALAISEKVLGSEHPDTVGILDNLTQLYTIRELFTYEIYIQNIL